MIRVVFCWPELASYMVSCWNELAKTQGIEVHVVCGFPGQFVRDNHYEHVSHCEFVLHTLESDHISDTHFVRRLVASLNAKVIFLPGWQVPSFKQLAFDRAFESSRFIMGLDTVRQDTWRQSLARFRLRSYFDRMQLFVVPGEKGYEFVRHVLRIPERQIRRGLYGFDFTTYRAAYDTRLRLHGVWPKKFLYLGRFVPLKGLDILLDGYRHYRTQVKDPWTLSLCGTGELRGLSAGVEGVSDLGFAQPKTLSAIFADHGAFVMPSRHEPWGVALGEAAAAGLPLVCSEACGALPEFERPYFNGLTVETGSAEALASALRWIHDHYQELPDMGFRSQQLAAAFSAEVWAARWVHTLTDLMN